jgi:tRNA/tmRNA/rRNA uracil-C5-methylase (TrmA/RlmC/RlmD family)
VYRKAGQRDESSEPWRAAVKEGERSPDLFCGAGTFTFLAQVASVLAAGRRREAHWR